jgi:hypothetical protein
MHTYVIVGDMEKDLCFSIFKLLRVIMYGTGSSTCTCMI